MKKGITEKKKSKKYKLWYRILAYVGVILILFTACALPISAVIDVSRGEGSDYNITANSSFPMDIGFTYRSSPDSTYNYTLMTSLGGFGQEWNRTSYGEDVVFYMYDELGNAVEVERGIAYTYGDVEWTTEEAYIGHMMGNRLGYQPINIGSTTPSSTDEQPVTTIVLKASDIVYNTAWTDWYRITRDSLDPPTLEELSYMGIPTIAAPHVIDPYSERFIGRLNINYDIVDCYGNVKKSNYSVEIDTQLRDDPIPLISVDDLLKYDIVLNPRLLISNYSAWWDVDYYTKTASDPVTLEGGEYEGTASLPEMSGFSYARYNMPFVSNGQSFDGIEIDSGVVYYYTQDAITQEITNRVTAITNNAWVDGYQNIELAYNYIVYQEFGILFNVIFTRIEDVVISGDSLAGVWVFDEDITTALQDYAGVPSILFYVDFTSGGNTFDTLGLYRPSASDDNVNMQYGLLRSSPMQVVGAFSYTVNNGALWRSGEEYRTIAISTPLANVGNASGSTLLNFLNACATKTSDEIGGEESYTTVNTTSDRTNEAQFAVWVKDSNFDLKNSVNLTIPLYDTSEAIMSDEAAVAAQIIYWSFPNALSFVRNSSSISFDDLSWTDWLVNGISGFINFEIVPGLSFGGLIGILVTFSVVLIFLKIFAGG